MAYPQAASLSSPSRSTITCLRCSVRTRTFQLVEQLLGESRPHSWRTFGHVPQPGRGGVAQRAAYLLVRGHAGEPYADASCPPPDLFPPSVPPPVILCWDSRTHLHDQKGTGLIAKSGVTMDLLHHAENGPSSFEVEMPMPTHVSHRTMPSGTAFAASTIQFSCRRKTGSRIPDQLLLLGAATSPGHCSLPAWRTVRVLASFLDPLAIHYHHAPVACSALHAATSPYIVLGCL